MEKLSIFDKNHGLTTLENFDYYNVKKSFDFFQNVVTIFSTHI